MDAFAAAVLAAAAAFAALRLGVSPASAAIVAVATLLVASRLLRSFPAEAPAFALAAFDLERIPSAGALDELLLTDSDRLHRPLASACADELVLDDVLAGLGEDSRVVRLFDASAMPSPAEF